MTVSCWNSTMVWCFPELVKVATADNEALKVFLWENYQWASRTGRAIRRGMRRWGGGISGKRSYPHNGRHNFSKWTLTRHRMWDIFTSVKKFSLKEPNEMLCPAVMVMVAFSLCVLALCRSSAVNIFNAFTVTNDDHWCIIFRESKLDFILACQRSAGRAIIQPYNDFQAAPLCGLPLTVCTFQRGHPVSTWR